MNNTMRNAMSSLVWSDDPKDKCSNCNKLTSECKCKDKTSNQIDGVTSRNFVAIFRLEKKHRGGKTVTVIDGLPKNEIFLRNLCKEIKSKCGTGGTYLMDGRDGILEIQGDKRESIKKIFETKKIKFK